MCWGCWNGKKQITKALFSTLLPCSVNDTIQQSWSTAQTDVQSHTSSHTLCSMMTRTKIPIHQTKQPPTSIKSICSNVNTSAQVSGNGFKISHRAALWKPFHMGEGFEKKRRRRKHRDPFEITFTCCCATWEERRGSFCEHLTKPTEIHTPLSFHVYIHENIVEETF